MNNKVNDKDYIKLTPFKGWVLENFPFIESDFDCITNYQLICKLTEYLNNVISNQNQVQELGTELVNAYNTLVDAVNLAINSFEEDITGDFNDLKDYVDNYFDNNFPELVSDKLDEMAEDGTLENLLNDLAHLNKVYNTYSDLIADSSTFTNGLKLKTLGYYVVNDGGEAEYIVTNTADVNKYQVELSNSLYLELILNDEMNIKQFGAKANDETFDNKNIIQNALNTKKSIIIGNNINEIYYISGSLNVYNDITFNSYLKMLNANGNTNQKFLIIDNYTSEKYININNPLLDGNRDITNSYPTTGIDEYAHGINIKGSNNININGGKIINCYGDGICISFSDVENAPRYSKNININNCIIDYNYRNGIAIISGENISTNNCNIKNENGYRSLLVEPNNDNTLVNKNLIFKNTYFYSNKNICFDIYLNKLVENVSLDTCTIENGSSGGALLRSAGDNILTNININNSTFINNKEQTQILINTRDDIIFTNNKILATQNYQVINLNSSNKNIYINNLDVNLGDTLRVLFNLKADNGKVDVINSKFISANATQYYSGMLNINGKYINVSNNLLKNCYNFVSLGTPISGSEPTHAESCDVAIVENNSFIGRDNYGGTGLSVQYPLDINTLIYNFNFLSSVAVKKRIFGTVTTSLGNDNQ